LSCWLCWSLHVCTCGIPAACVHRCCLHLVLGSAPPVRSIVVCCRCRSVYASSSGRLFVYVYARCCLNCTMHSCWELFLASHRCIFQRASKAPCRYREPCLFPHDFCKHGSTRGFQYGCLAMLAAHRCRILAQTCLRAVFRISVEP
jgi:hypothetical protein